MPKEFPAILIDRNRKSRSERHKHDYIANFDRECGFIAKVRMFPRDGFDAYKASLVEIKDGETLNELYMFKSGEAGLVMSIEYFIYDVELNQHTRARIKSLLGKSMHKYLFAETAAMPSNLTVSMDSQIQVLEDVAKDLKAGYDKMISHMGEDRANFYIANVEAAIQTVMTLRKLVD